MSMQWFENLVNEVIAGIVIGAGGADRNVQINNAGALDGVSTWNVPSTGTLLGVPRTTSDLALEVNALAGQTATLVKFNNQSTNLAQGVGLVVVEGVPVGTSQIFANPLLFEINAESAGFHLAFINKAAPATSGTVHRMNDNGTYDMFNTVDATNVKVSIINLGGAAADGSIDIIPATVSSPSAQTNLQGNNQMGDTNTRKIGFLGTAPVVKQTVAGVKVDAVAASILASLVAYGIVIDTTT